MKFKLKKSFIRQFLDQEKIKSCAQLHSNKSYPKKKKKNYTQISLVQQFLLSAFEFLACFLFKIFPFPFLQTNIKKIKNCLEHQIQN